MLNTQRKMFEIAKHLNELNSKGKVKKFSGNEKGYAKVIQICRGCSIVIRHEHNDDLRIALMITPSANINYPLLCKTSSNKFHEFFDNSPKKENWVHSVDTEKIYEFHSVIVNNKSIKELLDIISKLKRKFINN